MMLNYLLNHGQILGLLGFSAFSYERLRSYLHIFQQEEYDNARFLKWIARTGSVDRTATAFILLIFFCRLIYSSLPSLISGLAVAAAFLTVSMHEHQRQKGAKKPLVMTSRATRILQIALIASLTLAAALVLLENEPLIWLVAIHACPLLLVGANVVLSPIESRLKAKYWREAREKLERLNPLIIGVTGSYGKTSVKHILGHILQFYGPTLITPGSVNTPMGISRIVREQLRPSHKFFVAEMGAYGPGSISALCDLAPPRLGILTAVGSAHLERFGSKEVIARAKMELATAVLRNAGKVIINADIAELPAVSEQLSAHRSNFVTCGYSTGEVAIRDVVQTTEGLEFTLASQEGEFLISVPLFGRHQALNVAFAFVAARELGMPAEDIVGALRTTPQISHRLEVRRQTNGATIIDDGYNSNPAGFASALDLLGVLRRQNGNAILVTPGIVELGKDHDGEHFRLGKTASSLANQVYVIGATRIPTFVEGLRDDPGNCEIFFFDSFRSAQEKLLRELKSGDVVLIENDLPDLYERKMFL